MRIPCVLSVIGSIPGSFFLNTMTQSSQGKNHTKNTRKFLCVPRVFVVYKFLCIHNCYKQTFLFDFLGYKNRVSLQFIEFHIRYLFINYAPLFTVVFSSGSCFIQRMW